MYSKSMNAIKLENLILEITPHVDISIPRLGVTIFGNYICNGLTNMKQNYCHISILLDLDGHVIA